MKDLMHPHVVLLYGYALRRLRRRFFSQPSPNILLEYAERGDLRQYIENLQKDLEADACDRECHVGNFFHVKIGDFGAALKCDKPIPNSILYGQGTTRWRAPELFKNAPHSDLDFCKLDFFQG